MVPLLSTKLYPAPVKAGGVPRPRLVASLDKSLVQGRKLTLICAPAGFGKTTLAGQWLLQKNAVIPSARIGWLSLDGGDNDPELFLRYFVTALQNAGAETGSAVLSLLNSSPPPALDALLTLLINDLSAVNEHLILVLDDYHVIKSPQVHAMLAFLVENQPPALHLILITREEPPLPLSRLRVRRELAEIRAADLRFTSEETGAFLTRSLSFTLDTDAVNILESRTEGWIAGLQLASLSLQDAGNASAADFIAEFDGSNRHVIDYLADEVLDRQPPALQDFLLQTSILERMCGSLCQAVVDPAVLSNLRAPEVLAHLDAANLFVVPLDNVREWYRYHHLFSELLRYRLHRLYPELVPELYLRASRWYEQSGLISEALDHALAAENVQRAADLVEKYGRSMGVKGEVTTLLRWLRLLPEEIVNSRVELLLCYAWALFLSGQFELIEPRLVSVDRLLAQGPDMIIATKKVSPTLEQQIRHPERSRRVSPALERQPRPTVFTQDALLDINSEVTLLRSYLAGYKGDTTLALALAWKLLETVPDNNAFVRGILYMRNGALHLEAGNVEPAIDFYTQAVSFCRASGNVVTAVLAVNHLVKLLLTKGQLSRAIEVARQTLDATRRAVAGDSPALGMAYATLAQVLYERNELDAAEDYIRQALVIGDSCGHLDLQVFAQVMNSRLLYARGDIAGAWSAVQRPLRIARSLEGWWHTPVMHHYVRLCLAQGRLDLAVQWVQESDLADADADLLSRELDYLMLGQVLITQGIEGGAQYFESASLLIRRMLEVAEPAGLAGLTIKLLALQSLLFSAQSDTKTALAVLERALLLSEPECFIRSFVDLGPGMVSLLQLVSLTGRSSHYIAALRESAGAVPLVSTPDKKPDFRVTTTSDYEALTEREIRILRLINTGLSNREIAETLYISLNTVKTHIKNIYSKLDVHNRAQVINRARELALL